jgi:hypothetical protein
MGLEGTKVSPSLNVATLIGGGLVKPRVRKSSEVLGLNNNITSREVWVLLALGYGIKRGLRNKCELRNV